MNFLPEELKLKFSLSRYKRDVADILNTSRRGADWKKTYVPLISLFNEVREIDEWNDYLHYVDKKNFSEPLNKKCAEFINWFLGNKEIKDTFERVYEKERSYKNKKEIRFYISIMKTGSGLPSAYSDYADVHSLLQKYEANVRRDVRKNSINIPRISLPADNPYIKLGIAAARKKEVDHNKYLVFHPTNNRGIGTIFTACKSSVIRKNAIKVYNELGAKDNKVILDKIIQKRATFAQREGFESYAHFILENNTILSSPDDVEKFLLSESKKIVPQYKAIVEKCRNFMENQGLEFDIYDIRYVEKLYEKKFPPKTNEDMNLTYNEAKPLVFGFFEDFFGLKVNSDRENEFCEHYSITTIRGGKLLARLIIEPIAHESSPNGAFLLPVTERRRMGDVTTIPTAYLFLDIAESKDAKLTQTELETWFHELGHAFHMFSLKSIHPDENFNNIVENIVEMPSHFMQRFAFNEDVLGRALSKTEAKQYSKNTSDPMRDICILFDSWTDMKMHAIKAGEKFDPEETLKDFKEKVGLEEVHFSSSRVYSNDFLGNYGSLYFSYLWSRSVANDIYDNWIGKVKFDKFSDLSNKFTDLFLSNGVNVDVKKSCEVFYKKIKTR